MSRLSPPQRLLGHCPICHAAYDDGRVRFVGEKGQTKLFHCSCTACGHALLAVVLETPGAVSSVCVVTDLEAQDVARFQEAEPISEEECLAFHRRLMEDPKAWCAAVLDRKGGKS
jgi:hypothetical protein